jgi:4-amino-4-deoxy-L-arabinose transferase-like glycosyltransferase
VLGSSPILMKVARTFEPDAGIPFFAALSIVNVVTKPWN